MNATAFAAECVTCQTALLLQGDTVEQLLPLFLTLLKDEWPDVRLAIIGKLQAVNQVGCKLACHTCRMQLCGGCSAEPRSSAAVACKGMSD